MGDGKYAFQHFLYDCIPTDFPLGALRRSTRPSVACFVIHVGIRTVLFEWRPWGQYPAPRAVALPSESQQLFNSTIENLAWFGSSDCGSNTELSQNLSFPWTLGGVGCFIFRCASRMQPRVGTFS